MEVRYKPLMFTGASDSASQPEEQAAPKLKVEVRQPAEILLIGPLLQTQHARRLLIDTSPTSRKRAHIRAQDCNCMSRHNMSGSLPKTGSNYLKESTPFSLTSLEFGPAQSAPEISFMNCDEDNIIRKAGENVFDIVGYVTESDQHLPAAGILDTVMNSPHVDEHTRTCVLKFDSLPHTSAVSTPPRSGRKRALAEYSSSCADRICPKSRDELIAISKDVFPHHKQEQIKHLIIPEGDNPAINWHEAHQEFVEFVQETWEQGPARPAKTAKTEPEPLKAQDPEYSSLTGFFINTLSCVYHKFVGNTVSYNRRV